MARASHASYFQSGSNFRFPCPTDYFDGQNADQVIPELVEVRSASPAWMAWPGRWGASGSSPDGPARKGTKWTDPGGWSDTVTGDTCAG